MRCPSCGEPLTVHILQEHGDEWVEQSYCSRCRARRDPDASACPGCASSYSDFLASGLLGCANCYDAFSSRLAPLIERYHGSTPDPRPYARDYTAPRMARARTEILREAMAAAAIPGPEVPEKREARGEGEREGTILRLRIARNIEGLSYFRALSPSTRRKLIALLMAENGTLRQWPPLLHSSIKESRSGQLLQGESMSVLVGDEDHLRFEWLAAIDQARDIPDLVQEWADTIEDIDRALFAWQFRNDYGFLTACPGIGGRAIRLSVTFSVPALHARGEWSRWQDSLLSAGLEVRGPGGEGTPVRGSGQISARHWPLDLDLVSGTRHLALILGRLLTAEQRFAARH